jgi:ubiquinone biosynthesis protein COQ9
MKISNTKTIQKHNKYVSVREKDIAKRLRQLLPHLEFTKKTIINSGNYTFIPQLKFCKEIEKVF